MRLEFSDQSLPHIAQEPQGYVDVLPLNRLQVCTSLLQATLDPDQSIEQQPVLDVDGYKTSQACSPPFDEAYMATHKFNFTPDAGVLNLFFVDGTTVDHQAI